MVGALGGVVTVGSYGWRVFSEIFEALADDLPAAGTFPAALAGRVVEAEEKQEFANCAAHAHGPPAAKVLHLWCVATGK
jgi:hypothetical protein